MSSESLKKGRYRITLRHRQLKIIEPFWALRNIHFRHASGRRLGASGNFGDILLYGYTFRAGAGK